MMRKILLFSLTALLSAPALAWVPKLEETTAKNVIDGVYGRRDPVPTYQTLDLSVKDGKFVAGDGVVQAFDGGDACISDWLANPADLSKGSRLNTVTVSGQADQLYFQAQDARDSFKNLSAADALKPEYAGKRLADGELRVDINVRGLPTEKARDAYLVRMVGLKPATDVQVNTTTVATTTTTGNTTTTTATTTGSVSNQPKTDTRLIAPTRKSYINDFKQEGATWGGTLVYYFEPLKAGIGAGDKAEFLIRTEADTNCAYSVTVNLGSFQ